MESPMLQVGIRGLRLQNEEGQKGVGDLQELTAVIMMAVSPSSLTASTSSPEPDDSIKNYSNHCNRDRPSAQATHLLR